MAQLPGRPFQRLTQAQQNWRQNAGSFSDRLGGLLSGASPIGNLGLGLLAASGPSVTPQSFGQVLGQATQFASQREQQAMRNEAMRQAMAQQEQQQGLLAQQQAAQQQLAGLLGSPEMQTPEGQQQLMGLLAQANPQAFTQQLSQGLLGNMFAQPEAPESPFAKINPADFTPESLAVFQRTGDFSALRKPVPEESELTDLEKRVNATRRIFGRDLTDDELRSIAGLPTNDSPSDEFLNKPISANELENVRLPDGSTPPIGMTWGEAQKAGAKVYSTQDLKRQEQIETALFTLGQLEEMALGENGVFVDSGGSMLTNNILGRMAHGVANGIGAMLGTKASEDRRIWNNTSRGTIASLIRSMGESGALSDGDVQRALGIIPKLGATPDTERQARAQFEQLREILSRGEKRALELAQAGGGQVVDLGGGVTLEWQ